MSEATLHRRLARFDRSPSLYARADRVADAIGLPVEVAARLQSRDRFVDRLSRRLISQLDLGSCRDERIAATDLALVLQPPDRLATLAPVLGALWHGAAIRRVIARDERQALLGAIGAGLLGFVLDRPPVERPGAGEQPADLIDRIVPDGQTAAAAWLDSLPAPFAGRLALVLPALPAGTISVDLPPHILTALVREAAAWFGSRADG